jgi:hypothetical protein
MRKEKFYENEKNFGIVLAAVNADRRDSFDGKCNRNIARVG